jgi:hypothetical protein
VSVDDAGSSAGRFSYVGGGSLDDEPEVTYVELRFDEYGGPFWDREGCVGDDWALWEPLGMTRPTYDACMGWSGDQGERVRLLERLRAELPSSIEVGSTPR